MSVWVAGGLGGALLMVGAGALDSAPDWLSNVFFTLLVVSAVCLAVTRVGFEWQATLLKRKIDEGTLDDGDELPPGHQEWPKKARSVLGRVPVHSGSYRPRSSRWSLVELSGSCYQRIPS